MAVQKTSAPAVDLSLLRFLVAVLKVAAPVILGVAVLIVAYAKLGGEAFTFWFSAAAAVIPGIFIIMSQDIVRTAFWLLCSLTGFAGFYVLLGADFLALMQVTVYLGGIMILILFGVMLTASDPAVSARVPRLNLIVPGLGAAAVIAFGLLSALGGVSFVQASSGVGVGSVTLPTPVGTTVDEIGTRLLTDYVLPFEIASILLLAALVGAAYIARRGAPTTQEQEA